MLKILYLFLFVSLTACGQTSTDKIKSEIINSKTAKHINIPGTRLYIIPPNEFKVATTFIGLKKGENAMFNIFDLVGGNFYSNAATFSKEAFEKRGARVFDYKEIKVNGYPAKYIFLQGDLTTKGYSLVFGDTTFSTMIIAMYPITEEKTGKEIINALNTIWYDKSKKIDPFETANFSLNEKVSKFKFYQFSANLYMYSIGGIDHTEDKNSPMVIVSQLPKDNQMTANSIADMMLAKLQQYGLSNQQIKNVSTEKINGYDTYEAEVYGEMKGNNALIYYCVVTKGDKAIVIQGIANKNPEDNLVEFKKMARTIQVK